MPLYIADYRADTAHLSAAEHGAYLNLIMHYWSTGSLPDDDKQLARISCMTPSEWKRARPTIVLFFHDGWKHGRIDKELKRTADVSASYSARATQAANKRWAKHASSNATSMPDECLGMPSLQPPSQKKEDKIAADAASSGNGKYEFESGIIRLTAKDFAKWQKAYSYLDLAAELTGLTRWAGEQGPENWFFAVSGALTKRNRDLKSQSDNARRGGQLPLGPSATDGIL